MRIIEKGRSIKERNCICGKCQTMIGYFDFEAKTTTTFDKFRMFIFCPCCGEAVMLIERSI